MTPNRDTANIEAIQWGQLLPLVVDAVFDNHPDLDWLDVYLEWLYGDGDTPQARIRG